MLGRTDFPSEQMEGYVNRRFSTFREDGAPCVEVSDQGYVVRIHERGSVVFERQLDDKDLVLYWLLEDILFTAAHVSLLQELGIDNVHRHLTYTPEIWEELNRRTLEAFRKIGQPHEHWHMNGKRKQLESPGLLWRDHSVGQ